MNINRDYLIINDVKKSNVKLDNGSMFFYITDKNTQNIFVNLVINVSNNDLIQKYANIENVEDYTLTMNIVKPSNTYKVVEGKLHDKEKAIFEFNLSEDCCDEIGPYRCELLTKCNINDHEEITTSNKLTYKVKSSVLNDLDDIVEAPEYPLVIQLFDKLSDIEQYEEDRRANELARQLAEEQRQTRFDTLDADMADKITAMDDKMVDAENRISAKEEAVNTLIADTKADIDEYKTAKDQEIDEYKSAKDTEINNAITAQDNKIDEAISNQNDRITVVENNDVAQNNRLDTLENRATQHETRLTDVEAKNTEQDGRLDVVENKNQQQDNRLDIVEGKNVEQDNRLNEIEAIDVAQNTRLDAIEAKNQQQDERLLDIEKVNKRQDMNLKCLFAESKNNMIDITEEGNSVSLQNSTIGYTLVDEIKGNTLVNCNKEPDKELILNGNINTSADNTVTITEGVDGGLVDVALEGNTLVNVSKTKDSTAISMAYTVENSGNHIALQGEVDGNCRPVITGKTLVNIAKGTIIPPKSTTQDGFDSVEIIEYDDYVTYKLVNASKASIIVKADWSLKLQQDLVEGKIYTVILPIPLNTHNRNFTLSDVKNTINYVSPLGSTCWSFTATANANSEYWFFAYSTNDYSVGDNVILNMPKKIIILEGDYSDKPIPDYFEGLQSTFEDNLVTQEMVDSGEEIANNLGKYKVDYEVTGKNKFDINLINPQYAELTSTGFIVRKTTEWSGVGIAHFKLKKHTDYTFNFKVLVKSGKANFTIRDDVTNAEIKGVPTILPSTEWVEKKLTWNSGDRDKIVLYFYSNFSSSIIDEADVEFKDIQIEEGLTATEYEPYKEYAKTLYLNSPLLEGDTIEEKDGGIYHVHRSELVAYTEGDGASLITDKVHTLHQLSEPQYELIEQSNLAIPSYVNGHLDFNTAVPVEKVEFKPFIEELTYLYPSTSYTVQFNSDKAISIDITLGGTQLLAQNIVKGLNRISITTPSELVNNKLVIDGAGAKIRDIVVTDTDREFGYFEGMKSVGECEELEVKSINANLFRNPNIQFNNLRYLGNNEYVSTDQWGTICTINVTHGEKYTLCYKIKSNENITSNGTSFFRLNNPNGTIVDNTALTETVTTDYVEYTSTFIPNYAYVDVCIRNSVVKTLYVKDIMIMKGEGKVYTPPKENKQQLTHEPLRAVKNVKDRYVMIDGKWYIERKCWEYTIPQDTIWTKTNMVSNNSKYTRYYFIMDNILTNKTNLSNFAVSAVLPFGLSNYWSNCNRNEIQIISKSTQFYVQVDKTMIEEVASLMNGSKVIYRLDTPQYEPIDYNPFEVYSDTTHITTNSAIPTNITIKNHGFNCLLKPSTTYTISSNLGLNTVTTPSTLTEDCLRFMDTDTSDVTTMKDVLVLEGDWTSKADLIPANFSGIESAFEQEYDAEKGKYKVNVKVANEDKSKENNITFYINEPLRGVGDVKDRVYVKDDKVVVQRNCGIRAYEDGDFGTHLTDKVNTVYQLAQPTYEEIEYNDTKLFIESFKNSTLSYNGNVPVTSKLYYSYSVPIVDTVAQTASISDEQDQLIINLATEVAILEMMTL